MATNLVPRLGRSGVVLAALLLTFALADVAVAAPSHPGATKARHHRTHRRHKRRSSRRLATSLVRGVKHAHSQRAAVKAVDRMLGALGVGVRSSGGHIALHGTRHVYLYDFEVKALAKLLRNGKLARAAAAPSPGSDAPTTQQLADLLNGALQAGLPTATDATPFTSDEIAAVIVKDAKAASSHPSKEQSLTALILRSLAQADGINLLDAGSVKNGHFDLLATILLRLDMATGIYAKARSVAAKKVSSQLPAAMPGIVGRTAVSASGGCGESGNEDPPEGEEADATDAVAEEVGKHAVEEVAHHAGAGLAARGVAILTIAEFVLDGVHGSVLAALVDVQPVKDPAGRTKYGHVGEKGEPIEFQVKVTMTGNLPKSVKCGSLAGLTFPGPGGIRDVEVHWDNAAQPSALDPFGTIICGEECTRTNVQGIATERFEPKSELFDVGSSKEETGVVSAQPDYLSKFGNTLGLISEKITPKTAPMRWFVTHHAQGYLIDVTTQPTDPNPDQGSHNQTLHLHVTACDDGSGVARQLWTGTADFTQDDKPVPQNGFQASGPVEEYFDAGRANDTTIHVQNSDDDQADLNITLTLSGPQSPTAQLVLHTENAFGDKRDSPPATVAIQPYDGCPPPDAAG
jgi:hypothetical protein